METQTASCISLTGFPCRVFSVPFFDSFSCYLLSKEHSLDVLGTRSRPEESLLQEIFISKKKGIDECSSPTSTRSHYHFHIC